MLDVVARFFRDVAVAVAVVIVLRDLLERPRVIVSGLTLLIRYVKAELHKLRLAWDDLWYELTHWQSRAPPPSRTAGGDVNRARER